MTARKPKRPHASHAMTRWTSTVRAPAGEARFYNVRTCRRCGKEEMRHGAGHFLHGLESRCATPHKPKRPPLPRAVRELLRDVVKLDYDEESPFTRMVDGWAVPSLDAMALRAARILGTTPAAIIARARKVRK